MRAGAIPLRSGEPGGSNRGLPKHLPFGRGGLHPRAKAAVAPVANPRNPGLTGPDWTGMAPALDLAAEARALAMGLREEHRSIGTRLGAGDLSCGACSPRGPACAH